MQKNYVEQKPLINFQQLDLQSFKQIANLASVQNKNLRDIMLIQTQDLQQNIQLTKNSHNLSNETDQQQCSLRINSNNSSNHFTNQDTHKKRPSLNFLNQRSTTALSDQQIKLRNQLTNSNDIAQKQKDEYQDQYDNLYKFSLQLQEEKEELQKANLDINEKLKLQTNEDEINNFKIQFLQIQKEKSLLEDQLDKNQAVFDQFGSMIEKIQQKVMDTKKKIKSFIVQNKLLFLNDSNELNHIANTLEYLINDYNERQNQEEKYHQHIKETVQIIYDLQNKCTDLCHTEYQSNLQYDDQDLGQLKEKIKKLKQSGIKINQKWKQFFDQFLEQNKLLQVRQQQIILSLTDENKNYKEIFNFITNISPAREKRLLERVLDNNFSLSQLQNKFINQEIQSAQHIKTLYQMIIQDKNQYFQLLKEEKLKLDHYEDLKIQIQTESRKTSSIELELRRKSEKLIHIEQVYNNLVMLLKRENIQLNSRVDSRITIQQSPQGYKSDTT